MTRTEKTKAKTFQIRKNKNKNKNNPTSSQMLTGSHHINFRMAGYPTRARSQGQLSASSPHKRTCPPNSRVSRMIRFPAANGKPSTERSV